MFIKSLTLHDFRSHVDNNFEFDRMNLVRGPNGSGKSSLQLAIEYLLSNRCDMTDAGGKNAHRMIRLGSKEFGLHAEVILEGALLHVQATRNTHTGSWMAGNASGKNAALVIEKNVAPIECISAVLNATRFIHMKEDEQRALLAQALASDPVRLKEHELLKGYQAEVRTAAELDSLYDHFYKRRTETNRDIKALGDMEEPERPDGMPDAYTIDKQVAEVQTLRDGKLREKSKLESDHTSAVREFEAAQAQLKVLDGDVLSTEDLAEQRKIAESASAATKLDKKIREYDSTIAGAESTIAAEEKKLSAIEDHCPTCNQFIANAGEIRQGLRKEIEKYQASLETARKELADLREKRTALGDPKAANEKIDRHGKSGMAWARADAIVKKGGPVLSDTSAIDAEIKALDERLEKGKGHQKRILEYELLLRGHKERAEKKNKLDQLAAQLDQMCEYLGPKSKLRDELLGDKLDPFIGRVNEVLARFGFSCELELDPYRLSVQLHEDGRMLQLAQLSESEQFRFSVAFNVALAEATGVKLVVLDRIDMLQPDTRRALVAELNDSNLDQAVCLGTAVGADLEPPKSIPEGFAFFSLENVNGETQIAGRWDAQRQEPEYADAH